MENYSELLKSLITDILLLLIIIFIIWIAKKKKKNNEINKTYTNEEVKQQNSNDKQQIKQEEKTIQPIIQKPAFCAYQRKKILTKNEYYFYTKLKEVTNKYNLQILTKIRLADLIEVKPYSINRFVDDNLTACGYKIVHTRGAIDAFVHQVFSGGVLIYWDKASPLGSSSLSVYQL